MSSEVRKWARAVFLGSARALGCWSTGRVGNVSGFGCQARSGRSFLPWSVRLAE